MRPDEKSKHKSQRPSLPQCPQAGQGWWGRAVTASQGGKEREMDGPIRLSQVRNGGQMAESHEEQGSPPEQAEVAQCWLVWP